MVLTSDKFHGWPAVMAWGQQQSSGRPVGAACRGQNVLSKGLWGGAVLAAEQSHCSCSLTRCDCPAQPWLDL